MGQTGGPKEHRLAVVLNGGVSLAVWMGGFARELDNVRRASEGRSGPVDGADVQAQAEHRLFELWQEHTVSTRIGVDVIAGTSAGGLNGVLLAMAIAGDTPLTMLRSLWMRAAQLDASGLLGPQDGQAASVLNGDYFLDQVRGALHSLATSSRTEGADVVLTVTSTALRGTPRTVRDARGAVFTQPDHRRRFEFRRTGQRVQYDATAAVGKEFSTSTQDDFVNVNAVALTARASASFPVAFAPVPESDQMRREFRRWPTWETGSELEWLADGGILDNSPFEPVLRAISERPVESTWHRTLCYVVPSADESDPSQSLSPASGTDPGLQPPWTAVAAAALGLPREADLRDDVEQIHEVIRAGRSAYDVSRLKYLLDSAKPEHLAKAVTLATEGFQLYRQARAAAGCYQIGDATLPPEMFVTSPGEVVPTHVLGRTGWRWLPDRFPAELTSTWTWGLSAAQRLVAVLLRSLADDAEVSDQLRSTLSTLKLQVAAVNESVMHALRQATLPDSDPLGAAQLADATFAGLRVPETLGRLVSEAVHGYAAHKLGEASRAIDVLLAALCIEVVNGAGGVPVETKARPLFDFRRMGVSDPPAVFADAVRDAQAALPGGGNRASDILYGTRLGHFAAFGRPEWRAWDWLWGRISAVVHLGRLLDLTPAEVDELVLAVVAAEGTSLEDLRSGIARVIGARQEDLLATMRADGILPSALDSVFALLNSTRETAPPLPHPVATAGRTASLLAARTHPPGGTLRQRIARGATAPIRRRWWHRLTQS